MIDEIDEEQEIQELPEDAMFGMHVVVVGNPIDGISIIGPFTTGNDATEWADEHLGNEEEWWVVPLEAQETYEDEQS